MASDTMIGRRRFLTGALAAGGALALVGLRRPLAIADVPQGPRLGRHADRDDATLLPLADDARPRVHRSRHSASLPRQWLDQSGRARNMWRWRRTASPTGSSRSAVWSRIRWSSRSPISAPCRRAPRSPATTASRAGAASASGPASSLRSSSTRSKIKPETRYILFTCADQLEKTLDGSGRYYETHRPRGRLPPADHPRLRAERGDAAHRPWRAASAPDRADARLQDGEVRHADRRHRQLRQARPRQGRLLGRPRLQLVRGDLERASSE